MAAEHTTTDKIDEPSFELEIVDSEVDAGAEIALKCKVSCGLSEDQQVAADLRGTTLLIKDQEGTPVASIELTEFDGKTNHTDDCIVKVPKTPGVYTWLAVWPAGESTGIYHGELSASCSFTVKPHCIHIVIWDLPSAIECHKNFSIKIGVKCSSECQPDGWLLEVTDHNQEKLASVTASDEPWPDTAALYYAEVELIAPDSEGLFQWDVITTAKNTGIPHTESSASINLRVVAEPEFVLTIEAIDRESQTPVEGAKVVVHPYRTFTDKSGLAEVRVPKGEYKLFVSGKNYFPFRKDSNVKSNMRIRAELVVDRELTEADEWS